jgi:hypothetical protein
MGSKIVIRTGVIFGFVWSVSCASDGSVIDGRGCCRTSFEELRSSFKAQYYSFAHNSNEEENKSNS